MEIENESLNLAEQLETTGGSVTEAKRHLATARKSLREKKLRQYQEQWIKHRRDVICEVVLERKRLAKLIVL
jgi:hypothetical protein